MIKMHRKGDDESRANAEHTARVLVSHSDLPLLLRARSCMVLGCSDDDDALEWADEGVRVAELGMSLAGSEAGDVERQLLADCKAVRDAAKEAFEAVEASGEEQEAKTDEEVDRDASWEQKDTGTGLSSEAAGVAEPKRKKKRVRRVSQRTAITPIDRQTC